MTAQEKNWAGHTIFTASRVHHPTTVAEVQELVRRGRKLKVLGARHSFNDIADAEEDMLSLAQFDAPPVIDAERRRVTVGAGITYAALCPHLHAAGLALYNMASLPHITLAGAISTATHGSGDALGNLATAVTALEVVTGDGELVEFAPERDADVFAGAVVGLGGLGVITRVTLALQPAFTMQQEVYERLPFAEVAADFDAIMSSAYSVSLFTDWQTERVNQVWRKHRLTGDAAQPVAATYRGATRATAHLRPAGGSGDALCTAQMGQVGYWYERLPHFRAGVELAGDDELQTEYFVPRRHAVAALRVVAELGPRMAGVLKISEVRSMAADNLWMSMAYGEDTIGIHFSWHAQWPAVRQLLPLLEAGLAPHRPRPHWGKLFTTPAADLQRYYPKLADFRDLLHTYDPAGKFRNPFLERTIFATA